jgi:histidine triad (HIT) family protein
MKNTKSIFEMIIDREIDAKIVYEDDLVISIEDINPVAPYHFLIIPKEKISTLNDLNDSHKELLNRIFYVARNIAKEKNFDQDGYRTVFNCNEYGGQTVYHIHLHLISGRKLGWPPG